MQIRNAFALALFWCLPCAVAAQMRAPIPLTPEQFAGSPAGRAVGIVIRIDGLKGSTLRGELLRRKEGSRYETSGTHVALYYSGDAPIVMGSTADIASGAVVFVDAVVTSREHADVKRLVVVTKFVTVTAPHA